MKFLIDENLSFRLVAALKETFPGSVHLRGVQLEGSSDEAVWEYATVHDLTILSKDSDFHQRSFVRGAPPKVVWLRVGNCTTGQLVDLLRDRVEVLREFATDREATFLVISKV